MKQLYDKVGQVTARDYLFGGSPADESYTWDAAGNPTDFDGDDYDVNLLNEIEPSGGDASEFDYDTDGNLIGDILWTYEYDGENRLIEMVAKSGNSAAAKRLEFEYDYLHRRIEKRTYDATSKGNLTLHRIFVYDGYNCIAEVDGNQNFKRSYHWGVDRVSSLTAAGGVEALLLITDWDEADAYWPIYDLNGSVSGLFNRSGVIEAAYTYDSFGEATKKGTGSFSDGNPYRFATQYTDDDGAQTRADGEIEDLARRVEESGALRAATKQTGLVYYGQRYYDPSKGRLGSCGHVGFEKASALNHDPIAEAGGLNLYRFVGNDPVSRIDRFGLNYTQGDSPNEEDQNQNGTPDHIEALVKALNEKYGDFGEYTIEKVRNADGKMEISIAVTYVSEAVQTMVEGIRVTEDRAPNRIGAVDNSSWAAGVQFASWTDDSLSSTSRHEIRTDLPPVDDAFYRADIMNRMLNDPLDLRGMAIESAERALKSFQIFGKILGILSATGKFNAVLGAIGELTMFVQYHPIQVTVIEQTITFLPGEGVKVTDEKLLGDYHETGFRARFEITQRFGAETGIAGYVPGWIRETDDDDITYPVPSPNMMAGK